MENTNLPYNVIQKCMLKKNNWGPVRETRVLFRRPRFLVHPTRI